MPLRQLVVGLDRIAAQQPEGAGVGFDGKIREPAKHGVKQVEADPPHARFGPRAPVAPDDFRAAPPRRDEFRNHFGRILQIGVHRHDRIRSATVRQPGGQRALKTEVARKLDQFEPGIPVRLRADQFGGPIPAAVVHQHCPPFAAVPGVE